MASLTGASIASSYTSLLKLSGNTDSLVAGNNSNAIRVVDGDGTNSSLYLNTDRVGIGGQPTVRFQVTDTSTMKYESNKLTLTRDGGHLFILLNAGTTIANNEGLGYMRFAGNENGAGQVTGGSIEVHCEKDWSGNTDCPTRMTFWTVPDGSASLSERLRISEDGEFTGSGTSDISDGELKENIKDIENGLDTIKKLQGRTFTWKESAKMQKGTKYGVIAQEIEEVLPDLVNDKTGIREKGEIVDGEFQHTGEFYKSVRITGIIPVLIEAVKELSAKVEALENA